MAKSAPVTLTAIKAAKTAPTGEIEPGAAIPRPLRVVVKANGRAIRRAVASGNKCPKTVLTSILAASRGAGADAVDRAHVPGRSE